MPSTVDRFNCGQIVKKSGSYAKYFKNGKPSKDTPCDLHPGEPYPPTGGKGMHFRRVGKPSKSDRRKRPARLCQKCGDALPGKSASR